MTWFHSDGLTCLNGLEPEWEYGSVLAGSDWIGDFHYLPELEEWIVVETQRWLWLHPRHRWLCELDVDELRRQLVARDDVEEKVDVLAKRVEQREAAALAPFPVRWWRWLRAGENSEEERGD